MIVFTRPSRAIQAPLLAGLSAIGRARGLRAAYLEYLYVHGRTQPDPDVLALAGIEPPGAGSAAATPRPRHASGLHPGAVSRRPPRR